MKVLAFRRWLRWMAGAALSLLAFVVASSGQALADCNHEPDASSHFEHLVQAGAMPEAETPSERPRPCSGPMCSKAPAAPASPVSDAFAVEPWALMAMGPMILPPHASFLLREPGLALPNRAEEPIFHPPRSTSHGKL